MNAIVVVFKPTQDGHLFAEQVAADRGHDILRRGGDQDNAKTDLCNTSGREQTTPPFWTWFIENPRSCGA